MFDNVDIVWYTIKTMKKFFLYLFIPFLTFFIGFALRQNPMSSFVFNKLDNPKAALKQINDFRSSIGQSPMGWNETLCPLAEIRLTEIQKDFSHTDFYSRPDNQIFIYCPTCSSIGESLAKDFLNEKQLIDAWIKSPLNHVKNISLPFTDVCIKFQNGHAVLISSY